MRSFLALHVRTRDTADGKGRYGWLIINPETGDIERFMDGREKSLKTACPDAVVSSFKMDISVSEYEFWVNLESKI